LCQHWNLPAHGVADDAIFANAGQGSIAQDFGKYGVIFQPAKKADRRTGWQRLQQPLIDAGQPDKPEMFISRSCKCFWSSVPFLARAPRKPDDMDTRGPDHGADAARYGCLYERHQIRVVHLSGL
jgi:hypothetical protein